MKVLILGGDGFIGSHMRDKHVIMNDIVTCIDINRIRTNNNSGGIYIKLNLSNDTKQSMHWAIEEFKPDMIYNCVAVATPSYYVKHPIETFNLDFMVNKDIIDSIHKTKIPFIHFSTSETYGKTWSEPYTEESNCTFGSATKSRWIYATSKLLLDNYILSSKMNCCILRPFNFISHDMDWLPSINNIENKTWIPRVPSCFLNALFANKSMQVVTPGTQQRCYTYIDDAVDGIISVINNWNKCTGEILNIGNSNNEITITELAERMTRVFQDITGITPLPIEYIDGKTLYGIGYEDSIRRLFSAVKMERLTNWKAKIDLDETIRLTVLNGINKFTSFSAHKGNR